VTLAYQSKSAAGISEVNQSYLVLLVAKPSLLSSSVVLFRSLSLIQELAGPFNPKRLQVLCELLRCSCCVRVPCASLGEKAKWLEHIPKNAPDKTMTRGGFHKCWYPKMDGLQ